MTEISQCTDDTYHVFSSGTFTQESNLFLTTRDAAIAFLQVLFALTVDKFDRQFRPQKRDLIVTGQQILLVGRERQNKGPNKGQVVEVVKRRLPLLSITQVHVAAALVVKVTASEQLQYSIVVATSKIRLE